MNIKKYTATVAMLAILMLAFSGSALASVWSDNAAWNAMPTGTNNLSNFLSTAANAPLFSDYTGGVSGSFYVTQLGYESADTNVLKTSSGSVLFTNTGSQADFTAATVKYADLTGAYFKDTSRNYSNIFGLGSGNVDIYKLDSAWTLSNGLTLSVGTLILGLNDNVGCSGNDKDFDDMIVAISRTAPTPVPAAVWLLGSGMLGLMGFKKTRQKV
jgi:hypothetical protein